MRLVHLTDPHLSTLEADAFGRLRGKRRLGWLSWMRKRRHVHRREVLDRLCAAVRGERADVVAITGDLVQIGLPEEIRQATQWLEGFAGTPVLLVPGNHDLYAPDSREGVLTQWRGALCLPAGAPDAFPSRIEIDGVCLLGLCSALPVPFWSARGRLGAAQLDRLDAALADTAGRLRCVLLHHPPVPGQCPWRKALADAPALAALLARHGVELVLHGHLHRNGETLLGGHTRVLATGSASSAAPGAMASYRVLDVDRAAGGWRVRSRLQSLEAGGEARTVASADWTCGARAG